MQKTLIFLLLPFLWLSCDSDNDQTARLEVRLTDAPGDYQEVNVDIQAVEIHRGQDETSGGWTSLTIQKGIYNLLELTNGLDTLIASAELPAGQVSQIRFVLGENNSLKVDGNTVPLNTPSGQQSGLKLNVHEQLTAGVTYVILLDFDAARSIVKKGNGSYQLKPVITAFSEATTGAIKGTVNPAVSLPAVFAIAAGDTVSSTFADASGNFLLRGVPAGTYAVTISPKSGFKETIVDPVDVLTGKVTDVGVVAIPDDN